MRHLVFLLLIALAHAGSAEQPHWNQFRGPGGNGISTAKNLPIRFDEAKNVRWKIAIPGEGWSSPVVWGNEIWLTTGSDEKKELRAICVDLESGRIVKNIKVFDMIPRQVDPSYKHDSPHLNSPATPTPVVEDGRVFVHFGSQGLACIDQQTGDKIWERRDLRVYQPVRQGSSPIVDDNAIYIAYDGTDQQFFVSLDKDSGKTLWKKSRNVDTDWEATLRERGLEPKQSSGKPNDNKKSFATATLIDFNGRRQLIAPAAEATIAYDPANGDELWRVLYPGGFNVAARPIHAHGMIYVFTSGLTGHLLAVKVNGHGNVTESHVAWATTKSTPRIPSPVIVGDLLFMVTEKGGIARCLDAKTGEEFWKLRLGGDHWASPIFADGKLYFFSKQGDVTVLSASREKPEAIVKSSLNASFIASPAVAGESLILRSTTDLYCLTKGFERTQKQLAADKKQQGTNSKTTSTSGSTDSMMDWGKAYTQLLKKNPAVRIKVESGRATKEQVIAWMKKQASGKGKGMRVAKRVAKPGARPGSELFYAIVIGRLKSKDIELGELTMDIDYVIGDGTSVKKQIVGKRIKLVGVAGQFLDNLLQIKRGETIKVRTGDYNPDKKELGFGFKFQVLERTAPFKPENFGIPPDGFRGFRGELVGKVVEAIGYEVLLEVTEAKATADSKATNASSIQGNRIRIAGFYNDHRDAFSDLHEGDVIRVSTVHRNVERDALDVTDTLEQIED